MLWRVLLCGTAALLVLFAVASSAAAKPGDIFVGTDGSDDSLVRIDPTTGTVRDVATISTGLAGMDFAGNGSLYVGEYFDGNIYRVNPRTGAFASFLSDPPVISIYDVDRGPGRFMYAADNGTTGGAGAVLRFSPTRGNPVALQSEGDYANLTAIAIRFSDETVFSTSHEGRVMSYKLRTGAHRVILSDPALPSPEGIALTPDGRLYVSSGDVEATIYRVNVRTGALTPVASGGLLDSGGVDCNYELGVDLSGNLLSAVICGDRIVRVDPRTGAQTLVAQGNGTGPDDFVSPEGITVEPPRCGGKLAAIVGTRGRDVLRGSRFGDVIAGLGGRDVIRGRGGNDVICGGKGRDRLIGGKGKDRLVGQAGRDVCLGGPGRDRLKSC